MKKLLLLFFVASIVQLGIAQDTFFDDFEGLSEGDYVSQGADNWTTWSGNTGGAEDARVSTAQAASGTNSIYFQGTPAGGPQDVILTLGGLKTTGLFTFSCKVYVPAGKGAYYNFQGAAAVGVAWSMNLSINTDGSLVVDDGNTAWVNSSFEHDKWQEITIEANIKNNFWRVLVDGICVGSFANSGTNRIGSVDFFPRSDNDIFYIDDVSYSYEAIAPDVEVASNDAYLTLGGNQTLGISGSELNVNGVIFNTGANTITDFDLDYSIGDDSYTQSFTGVNIVSGENMPFTLDNAVLLSDETQQVSVAISSVNGNVGDDNDCNNKSGLTYSGFTPAPTRKVWAEEGTGTWCPWCPRGDVFMNLMKERYGELFVGIAVHNADPMTVAAWDNGVGPFPGFTGYPGVIFERDEVIDPSELEAYVVDYLTKVPKSVTEIQAINVNNTDSELVINLSTTFDSAPIGEYRLVVGIIENGVTGTASGYAQANNYAGGNNGVMGGYELLPSPVPASMMVYNHTSRALLTPFAGMSNAFGTEAGVYENSFNYTIPAGYDVENLEVVVAVLAPDGSVDNANSVHEFVTNVGTFDRDLSNSISVFPNPTSEVSYVKVNLEKSSEVSLTVTDALGHLISTRSYGNMNGEFMLPIDANQLKSGIYYIKLIAGDTYATKKIIVAK